MAQSAAYTPIVVYKSETAEALPSAANLEVGELAVNIADGKIYTKNTAGDIVDLSGGNEHTHTAVDITDLSSTVATELNIALRPEIVSISDTGHTLSAVNESKVALFTASTAITVTVPNNTDVSLPVGYIIHLHQTGTGQITVTAGSGVTVSSANTPKTRARYSSISLVKTATNSWIAFGDTPV